MVYDAEAIYVGVRLTDSRPDRIVWGETRRDASLTDSDAFILVLDTYKDGQNAFVFGTNPNGVEFDGQVTQEGVGGVVRGGERAQAGSGGGFNLNWDGAWEVNTSMDEEGWTAEFRIPFRTLRFGAGRQQVWGLNMARHIRRRNEQAFWSPVPRQYDLYRVSMAGELHGLEVPQKRVVQATPYVLAAARRTHLPATDGEYENAFPLEAGGELKVGLTPSLTMDLTLNTDFAQVEVDEQQVNLTRFSLFFPEKRPFFLENAGTFSVGSPQSVEMFFSRRIGMAPGGAPAPILGGGRVTGRVGGTIVGLLDIQTQGNNVQPPTNYGVVRVLRELPNRSRIGGLVTHRIATDNPNDQGQTYSLDGRWGMGQNAWINGYGAMTQTPGPDGRHHALNIEGKYQTRTWDLEAGYSEIGDDFDPEVGFLQRRGYRAVQLRLQRNYRPTSISWIRELRPHVSIRSYWNFDGHAESQNVHLDNHFEFDNGAFFSPAINYNREGVREPFEIAEGVVVSAGMYEGWSAAWEFYTDQGARLSMTGELDFGSFLSGSSVGGRVAVNARGGGALSGAVIFSYDDVRLPEGDFQVFLTSTRLAYAFTPRLYLQSLIQYNNQDGVLSANLRFGWLGSAGTGLFLVINEIHDLRASALSGMRMERRGMTLKYVRLLDLTRS